MITAALMVTLVVAKAQNTQSYWVVETEKEKGSIVKIYNSENQLISESKVARRIDVNKKKERKMLNKLVKQHEALAWSKR